MALSFQHGNVFKTFLLWEKENYPSFNLASSSRIHYSISPSLHPSTFFKISIFKIYFSVLGLGCGLYDLVSGLGIEPVPPCIGSQSLSHWTTRKVPTCKCFLSVRISYPYWSPFQVSAAFYLLCSCFCDNDLMGSALFEVTGHFLPSQSSICGLSQHLTIIKTNVIMDTAPTANN